MNGKTINGFTLQRQLGIGGMAEVWYAENAIEKQAAVKLLLPKFCNDEAIVARFRNEAKVMVKLDHPNIRQVYDFGDIDGRPCIVMEYLEGDDLKTLMKQGRRFTAEELERWWNQIADALNYTHAKGIVHRDIKPSNLFLDAKGNIKLLDFGIAKIKESISMTQTGAMMGTLMYMSPEQVQDSKHLDYRTDVYSLAVTFVHLLTGKAPYDTTTSNDYAIRKGIVEIPLDLSSVPEGWKGFLMPYLEKDPTKRPALRPFEAVDDSPVIAHVESVSNLAVAADVDEGTVVAEVGQPTKTQTQRVNQQEEQTSEMVPKPKSKNALWIALGVVAVLAVVLFLLLNPNPDKQAYQACQTVNDYRNYLDKYGRNAKYYAEAKQFVDDFVADSVAEAQKIIAKKQENEAFAKCTTLAGCENYLKDYPNGRYVKEVRDIMAELEKEMQKKGFHNGHEYVDLGLPSGTLWATCNIGAKNPEDFGGFYAWGETKTKNSYDFTNYKYAKGSEKSITKYCDDPSYGYNGFKDKLTVLKVEDDAAAVNWGDGWRIPSIDQWAELNKYTKHKWVRKNHLEGLMFTANNGESIFLPAANADFGGCVDGEEECYYWSRNLVRDEPVIAYDLWAVGNSVHINGDPRDCGLSVRPVLQKQ